MVYRFLFLFIAFFLLTTPLAHAQLEQGGFTILAGDEARSFSKEQVGTWKKESVWGVREPVWSYHINLQGKTIVPSPKQFNHDFAAIYTSLEKATADFNHAPENATLVIADSKVVEFNPGKPGSQIDLIKSTKNILEALQSGYNQGNLVIVTQNAATTLGQTNNLGIKELLATGSSTFNGSPANRRHNINIGIKHMTGLLVAPGDEFSFNEFLGPVEEEFGFLPELVIKKDGTVPELGGGLCQVSSTLFRSVMKAGLPVTQRKNHSYAVQYYAPQGTDATIYPGVIDLKFINDTPGSILIWPYLKDKNTLLFELYGTRDNRLVQLDAPIQYDKKSDGSLKAMWKRVVINNGKTKTDEFYSNYLPPALFHKEEQFPKPAVGVAIDPTTTSSEVKTETQNNEAGSEIPEKTPPTEQTEKEQL